MRVPTVSDARSFVWKWRRAILIYGGVLVLFGGWAGFSFRLHAVQSRDAAQHDPSRFERMSPRYAGLRIGVALSGGGYRAALFHAGVLSALEEMRIMPTNLTSVSGGSITAAFYALGGSPDQLLRAAQEGRLKVKREFLNFHNARRLPTRSFDRTTMQADLLDRVLLRGKRFGDLDRPGLPTLLIAATNLPTGEAVGITRKAAFFLETLSPPEGTAPRRGLIRMPYITPPIRPSNEASGFPETERLADAVAASGAFPLVFPAVVRRLRVLGGVDSGDKILRLADGGLTDNTGLSLMLAAEQAATYRLAGEECGLLDEWLVDLILVSDAGGIFAEQRAHSGFRLSAFDGGRALDIVYARVKPQRPRFERHAGYPYSEPHAIAITPQDMLAFPLQRTEPSNIQLHLLGNEPVISLDDDTFLSALAKFPGIRDSLLGARRLERQLEAKAAAGRPVVMRTNADAEAQSLIDSKISEGIEAFLRTETLDEEIPAEDAERVYYLGRYLTFNRFARIDSAATKRLTEKRSRSDIDRSCN